MVTAVPLDLCHSVRSLKGTTLAETPPERERDRDGDINRERSAS